MNLKRVLAVPALIAAMAALLVACGDDDDSVTPAPSPTLTPAVSSPMPSPTLAVATPAATAPVSPTLTPPPTAAGPTGIAALDTTMLIIVTRDAGDVMKRVVLTEMACTTKTGGLGGPPLCAAGEADGTVVKVFPWSSCEGQYAREAQVRDIIATALQPLVLSPMTVVRIEGVSRLGYQPGDRYGLIYRDPTPGAGAVMLAVNENGEITRLYRGCNATAEELIERAGGSSAVIFPK